MNLWMSSENIITIVVTSLIAWLLTRYYYRRSMQNRRLAYSVASANVISRRGDGPGELRVTYAGQDVASVVRLDVFVWNAGHEAIRKEDLQTADPLHVELSENLRQLEGTIEYQSKPSNNVSLDEANLSFDYLNAGDGLVAEIFVERSEEGTRSSARLLGEIVGVNKPPRRVDYEFHSGLATPLLSTAAGTIFLIITCAAIWAEVQKNWQGVITLIGVLSSLMGAVFVSLSLLMLGMGLVSLFSRDRVPLDLVMRGEVKKWSINWLRLLLFGKGK